MEQRREERGGDAEKKKRGRRGKRAGEAEVRGQYALSGFKMPIDFWPLNIR